MIIDKTTIKLIKKGKNIMYTEFTNITDYLDCKYQLEINDKFIGKFYGYQEFKKLIKSYIKSRLIELLEKEFIKDKEE